ncbi:MAG: hypothetical protein Q8L49_07615 [Burkholderiaceae bacterium]|nr:hypothetical protein [Burkholderiaceae bacterium]
MHLTLSRPLAIVLTLAGLLAAPSAQAGPGGDEGHAHGNEPAAASGRTQPRFAATSELFELVGVVNGTQLTLYLDRSDDNSPVKGAKLELELGGARIDVKPGADGEFAATLAQPLKPGVTPVTATVTAGTDSDLLAGEINVHEPAPAEAPHARSWKELAGWTAAGLALLGALAWIARRFAGQRAGRIGAAA